MSIVLDRFAPVEAQLGHLFRDQAYHEDDYRHGHEHGRGGPIPSIEGEDADEPIRKAHHEHHGAHREKDFQWGKEGGDLDDDGQEAEAVGYNADLAFAGPFFRFDRDIGQTVACPDEGKGDRRGIGKGIGQKVEKAARDGGFHGPVARGEILDPSVADIGCQGVEHAVGKGAVDAAVGAGGPGTHYHVIGGKFFEKPGDIGRVMLAVSVQKEEVLASGMSNAAFHRCAVAHVVGMGIDLGPGCLGPR